MKPKHGEPKHGKPKHGAAGLLALSLMCGPLATAQAADNCVKKLMPCPDSPNCIATNDPNPDRRTAPWTVKGEPETVWPVITQAVLSMERTAKVAEQPGYLHATFTSRLIGYVDDVEFTYCEGGKQLWVRSASREGYWDMGANSGRVDDIRALLKERGLVE